MELTLTAVERDMLLELLRDELGRLKGEIYKTETPAYKDQLKTREAMLVDLIARLEASQAA